MALSLLSAGCGGGDDSADAQQIDKATYVRRANGICQQVSGKMTAEFTSIASEESAKPGYNPTKSEILLLKEVVVPGLEEELQKIRALGIPDDAKQNAQGFLGGMQSVIDRAKAKPKQVAESSNVFEAAELAGAKFGITECPLTPVE